MVNFQAMLGTPNELEHYWSRGSLGDYIGTESISERLIKIPGKNLGPRCSDVELAVNKVNALKYPHRVLSAAFGPKRPLFRQLNPYSAITNRTHPQRTSCSSQGGGYRAQLASSQVKDGPSSNARQPKKRRKKSSDDSDEDDDRSTPGNGKKSANSKGNGRKFACPFKKKFPHSSLQCHDGGGFDDTSRVKEHIYRAHDKYQCRLCGETFEKDDKYEDHVRMNSCTPPSLPERPPILVANRLQLKDLRSRAGLQDMSERDRWHKIYKLLFLKNNDELPRHISPYVEVHAEHRAQEAPRQLREIPQQQQEVQRQLQIPAQLQQFFQQSLQQFLQPLQGIQQQIQVLSQQMRESQQANQQVQNRLAGHEARIQAQERAWVPPDPPQSQQDGVPLFNSLGSQFRNSENTSVGDYAPYDGFMDPRFLRNTDENGPSTGPLV
ncbi:hypothetical protein F4811DRAFT_555770 [Daldinia bambusicola]|nr:hypothetical protein F4811DRAFT_555770 [Daldinia bambusicola]